MQVLRKVLKKMLRGALAAAALVLGLDAGVASAVTVPFTEDFTLGNANWDDRISLPLGYVAAGGPDGGSYVTTSFNYFGFVGPFGSGPVLFRATGTDVPAPSGGAFTGNWLADGVGEVSLWLRHDAPEALTPFLRVAALGNFPGAVLPSFLPVAPDTWTQVTFEIDVDAPWCVGEGVSCAAAFSSVGNLQFGTNAPAGLVATNASWTLDLDKVSVASVPEPGTALLLAVGVVLASRAGRRDGLGSRG